MVAALFQRSDSIRATKAHAAQLLDAFDIVRKGRIRVTKLYAECQLVLIRLRQRRWRWRHAFLEWWLMFLPSKG